MVDLHWVGGGVGEWWGVAGVGERAPTRGAPTFLSARECGPGCVSVPGHPQGVPLRGIGGVGLTGGSGGPGEVWGDWEGDAGEVGLWDGELGGVLRRDVLDLAGGGGEVAGGAARDRVPFCAGNGQEEEGDEVAFSRFLTHHPLERGQTGPADGDQIGAVRFRRKGMPCGAVAGAVGCGEYAQIGGNRYAGEGLTAGAGYFPLNSKGRNQKVTASAQYSK